MRIKQIKNRASKYGIRKTTKLIHLFIEKGKGDYHRLDPSKTITEFLGNSQALIFCDKNMTSNRITVVEKGEIPQDKTAVAEKLNDYFSNAVKNLNIKINDDLLNDDSNEGWSNNKSYQKIFSPSILNSK